MHWINRHHHAGLDGGLPVHGKWLDEILGAKAIAASLPGLTSLDLASNNIGTEGAKALLDAWSLERRNGQLYLLVLRDNSDLGILPKVVFETADGRSILAAYRRFILTQEKQTLRPLNELKLLVVGNEAVGKTSLLRYMIKGQPRDPNEPKTPGIVQREKIEIQGWSPEDCQVRLNVWDFGGQEMMRGTHRFFLTERSLYLLVFEDRRQDDRSIYDWMKTIRNRGKNSPVIVVINKSDAGKQDLRLDENGIQEKYQNIVAFLRTPCDPGEWAEGTIDKLRRKVIEVITQDERLKHVRDPIPANWLSIKNRFKLAFRR